MLKFLHNRRYALVALVKLWLMNCFIRN